METKYYSLNSTLEGNIGGLSTVVLPQEIETNQNISYKYAEDQIIADFHAYIDKTYGQHYQTEEENFQAFDAWIALGDASPTFRNTDRKSTRLNSSHIPLSRMPSSA